MRFTPVMFLALVALSRGVCPAAAPDTTAQKISVTLRSEGDTPVAVPNPGATATVLVFVTPECPMANRYAPALHELAKTYAGRVAFYRVYAAPKTSTEAVANHEREYRYGFPALLDAEQSAKTACGATRTPEVAVIDAAGALRYRGAVDDRYADLGHYRQAASKHYLRDALDAVLSGSRVGIERSEAVGCFIPLLESLDKIATTPKTETEP